MLWIQDHVTFLNFVVLTMICLHTPIGKRVWTVTYTVKVVRSWWHLSLGMQAVKLCSNKILQFSTQGAG